MSYDFFKTSPNPMEIVKFPSLENIKDIDLSKCGIVPPIELDKLAKNIDFKYCFKK